jgi:hypothetical protein
MCDPTGGIATTVLLAAASTGANYLASQQQQSAMSNAQNQSDRRMADIITRDSMANFNAANEAAARNKAYMDAENAKQEDAIRRAQGIQDESIQRNSAPRMNELLAQEEEAGRQRYAGVADAAENAAVSSTPSGGNEDSTRVVNDSIKKSLGQASNYLRGLGNARAGMESFQNTMLGQNIALNQANQQLGQIERMSAGSRNAYGQEINSSNSIQNLLQQRNALNTGYDRQLANVDAQSAYNNAVNAGQEWQTVGSLLGTASQLSGMGAGANGWQNPTRAANRAMLSKASANTTPVAGYKMASLSSRPVPVPTIR